MGSKVTIIGRNPKFLPAEEPEISEVLKREMRVKNCLLQCSSG